MEKATEDVHETSESRRLNYISKERYKELAKEIKSWEDDVRHIGSMSRTPTKKQKIDLAKQEGVRPSLAPLDRIPVSKLRQHWESLMADEPAPARVPRPPLKEKQTFTIARQGQTVDTSTTEFPLPPPDNKGEIVASSTSCDSPRPLPEPPAPLESMDVPELQQTQTLPLPPPPPPPVSTNTSALPASLSPPVSHQPEECYTPTKSVSGLSKSADCIDLFESTISVSPPECPSSVQHTYYNRPRPGVLRNWPNTSNLDERRADEDVQPGVPRQRSVTFLPKRGTAPGDTSSGETETDSGGGIYDRLSSSKSDDEDEDKLHQPRPLAAALPSPTTSARNSTFKLESAALLANSDAQRQVGTAEINDNVSSSDFEVSEPETLAHANPRSPAACARRRRSSSRCDRSGGVAPRRRSSSRRISRDASALLDLDMQATPVRLNAGNVKLISNAEASAVERRRNDRIDEITKLLDSVRQEIISVSSALQDCRTPQKNMPASVRSESHFENSRSLLIACQRQQALMEELSLLNRGSPVLVPPLRGEPLRARFCLNGIRLAIKPEAPYSQLGGFAVVGEGGVGTSTPYDGPVSGRRPVKYHLMAILKCVGEGRLYYTDTITLMRVCDLPVGSARAAPFIDLPANIEIVPLRPDFLITIEIYCMTTGDSDSMSETGLSSLAGPDALDSPVMATPKRGLGFCISGSLLSSAKRKKMRSKSTLAVDSTPTGGGGGMLARFAAKQTPGRRIAQAKGSTSAFVLLSSVNLRHHDSLLSGQLPQTAVQHHRDTDCGHLTFPTGMPLFLANLPNSSPLAGPLGLIRASVHVESVVLRRGFLTIFEESGGLGVWQKRWCKLLADRLLYWSYPEDEGRGIEHLGRIDLCHVATPGAVPAPRKLCVRSNAIYMRSIFSVNAQWLSSSTGRSNSATSSADGASLLFTASSDYRWLEHKHLLCADTPVERQAWLESLTKCLEVLQSWMPEHFARLQRYDARLQFCNPVSAALASGIAHNQSSAAGSSDT
ncbi:positive regulation of bleb assembly [Sparganum proliferum]